MMHVCFHCLDMLFEHAFPRVITCIKQLAENEVGLERHVKTLRVHRHRVYVYIYIHVYVMYCSMCVLKKCQRGIKRKSGSGSCPWFRAEVLTSHSQSDRQRSRRFPCSPSPQRWVPGAVKKVRLDPPQWSAGERGHPGLLGCNMFPPTRSPRLFA
jgi:hypothetical protein